MTSAEYEQASSPEEQIALMLERKIMELRALNELEGIDEAALQPQVSEKYILYSQHRPGRQLQIARSLDVEFGKAPPIFLDERSLSGKRSTASYLVGISASGDFSYVFHGRLSRLAGSHVGFDVSGTTVTDEDAALLSLYLEHGSLEKPEFSVSQRMIGWLATRSAANRFDRQ